MDILLLLIPLSIVLVCLGAWAFRWSLDHDQFDDLERHGRSILEEDGLPANTSASASASAGAGAGGGAGAGAGAAVAPVASEENTRAVVQAPARSDHLSDEY